jgi:hypothetical protein
MKLYWFTGRVPELRGLPWGERQQIIEDAVWTLPITRRNLAVACGVLLALTAPGVLLTMLVSETLKWFWLPLGAFGVNVLLLNLARPRMRDLLEAKTQTEREAASQ